MSHRRRIILCSWRFIDALPAELKLRVASENARRLYRLRELI
jgi:hypothetical protein